jgi:SAM-dependent methyltransferase
MSDSEVLSRGIEMPTNEWLEINRRAPYGDERDDFLAAYPPKDLMQKVSGLTERAHFAQHGAAIFEALNKVSDRPIREFRNILDFGCGCGRLARMFKGYTGTLTGCDIDASLVEWINTGLPFINAVQTQPNHALPFADGSFDCVISISVFTHMNEAAQNFYLTELARITKPGAMLFLTVHAERAMERAQNEQCIFNMLDIPRESLPIAHEQMLAGQHAFVVQERGHLTTSQYKYGITFIPADYIRSHWARYFDIVDVPDGAIHDFQGIAVCRRR